MACGIGQALCPSLGKEAAKLIVVPPTGRIFAPVVTLAGIFCSNFNVVPHEGFESPTLSIRSTESRRPGVYDCLLPVYERCAVVSRLTGVPPASADVLRRIGLNRGARRWSTETVTAR